MISFFISAVAFIIIFSLLILIHEFGHFYAAKKSGVKVEEFGIGLPPRIWGKKKGETLYSVNWIPFGGFVKLLGEDSRDLKMLKNKRSFISKPARIRVLIVTAGVIMNLLLAYILLTVGFTFGIQPLILDENDVFENIKNGNIELEDGIFIKSVKEGSEAESLGVLTGDKIVKIEGEPVNLDNFETINGSEKDEINVTVMRNGEELSYDFPATGGNGYGIEIYQVLPLPRIAIAEVKKDSFSEEAGLQALDIIISVNDEPIYTVSQYEEALRGANLMNYEVLRDGEIREFEVELVRSNKVIISEVVPGGPADAKGIKKGDIIVSIDGKPLKAAEQLVDINSLSAGKDLLYKVERNGEMQNILLAPGRDGLIGVYPSILSSYENREISVFPVSTINSVMNIKDIRYPFWIAPIRAFEESGQLAVLTFRMFGDVIRSIVTSMNVPEGVAGPVGIAQLTHVFVQEGLLSVIRFVALLSMSLAILNIIPFPALDGGRLLFILFEVITGKRVSPRREALVHAIGFLFLMVLIFIITWNDILRFFQ
jgi:regulator of sigma E protease